MKTLLAKICRRFGVEAEEQNIRPYGSGHINDTSLVEAANGEKFILQKINTHVFREPEKLMENFDRVTRHLRKKLVPPSRTIELLYDGDRPFVRSEEGEYFRLYRYIGGVVSCDVVENASQAFSAAAAFGRFQNELSGLPGGRLHETIPDFHHTPKRYEALLKAIRDDVRGRVKSAGPEIDFAVSRSGELATLIDLLRKGELKERITHNDTKLNNVLLSASTGEGIAVIDLDTVMPGLAHYDFGDMVRTGVSPAAEDERDLDKVGMRFAIFESLLRGYLEHARHCLNDLEIELLPFSGKLITLEIGIRFLTDYLSGDVYFKTARPGHNLDRCRTQFKLVSSIEAHYDDMMKLLSRVKQEKSLQ